MLKDGKLKWETKLGEIAEQTHLFLLYKAVRPVSSNAKPLWSRSFPRDAAAGTSVCPGQDPCAQPCTVSHVSLWKKPMSPRAESLVPLSLTWPGLLCDLS